MVVEKKKYCLAFCTYTSKGNMFSPGTLLAQILGFESVLVLQGCKATIVSADVFSFSVSERVNDPES